MEGNNKYFTINLHTNKKIKSFNNNINDEFGTKLG